MGWLSILASLAVLAPGAAPAEAGERDGVVTIAVGEAVTLTLDDGGRPHETARGPAPRLTPFEAAAVWNLTNRVYGEPLGAEFAPIQSGEDGVPEADPIAPGAIRIKFVSLERHGTTLLIRNGYPAGLAYRARIRVSGSARTTDVCEVLPRRVAIEHWPEPIEAIELSRLHFVPWIEGQTPICE